MFLLFITLCISIYFFGTLAFDNELLITEEHSDVDFKHLRNLQEKHGIDNVFHSTEIMRGIRNGEKIIKVKESRINKFPDSRKSFTEATNINDYDSNFTYTLLDDVRFVSLDEEESFRKIQDMSDNHLMYCSNEHLGRPGDIFLATVQKESIRSKSLEGAKFSSYWRSHKVQKNKKGFNFLRKVISVKSSLLKMSGHTCSKLMTEEIHPLEMFHSINVSALVSTPYNISFSPSTPEENSTRDQAKASRKDISLNYIVEPGYPLISCEDYTVWSPQSSWYYTFYATSSTFVYQFASTKGCADYNYNLGGFNLNYNPSTKGPSSADMSLSSGLTCRSCYAYAGASFQIHMEYSFDRGFGLLVKLAGEAGYNLEVYANNPSLGSMASVNLLSPAVSYSTWNIGTAGMTFNWKFGGMTASVGGSGTCTGAAKLKGGFAASASVGLMYAGGSLSIPTSYSLSGTYPAVTYDNFKCSDIVSTVNLNAKINIKWSYGWTLSLLTDVNLGGSTSYALGSVGQILSVSAVNPIARRKLYAIDDTLSFAAGDDVLISAFYKDYIPNKKTTLIYTLVNSDSNEMHQVMTKDFTVSSTGTGVFEANWIVPWDTHLETNSTWTISVQGSNNLNVPPSVATESIQMEIYDDYASIFESPADKEIVKVETPYTLRWNKGLLKRYAVVDPQSGYGISQECPIVQLMLVTEVSNATSKYDIQTQLHNTTWVNNTGQYNLEFDKSLLVHNASYYVTVNCYELSNIFGWSGGYFNLVSREHSRLRKILQEPPLRTVDGRKRKFGTKSRRAKGFTSVNNKKIEATCNSQAKLTTSTGTSAYIDSVSIGGWSKTLGMQSDNIELSSREDCYAKPPAGTPAGNVPTKAPVANPAPTKAPVPAPTSDGFDPVDNCEVPNFYRDGYCDSENNVAACKFDGGDCCPETCVSGPQYTCGSGGYNCIGSAPVPTLKPTTKPTIKPTTNPTLNTALKPTIMPTTKPTTNPTLNTALKPTIKPTTKPTIKPTTKPTTNPTLNTALKPTIKPTTKPTIKPTTKPTIKPTTNPTPATPSDDFDPAVNCDQPVYYRDGWCDSENNVYACEFDGGDCCPETCVSGPQYTCGDNGYDCLF